MSLGVGVLLGYCKYVNEYGTIAESEMDEMEKAGGYATLVKHNSV